MAANEENGRDIYKWEGSIERSWDSIQEGEDGTLKISSTLDNAPAKRRMEIVRSVRKGLIRYMYVILDLSKGMSKADWKPYRCTAVSESLKTFIREFLDQSPISQIGIVEMKGSKSSRLSNLSGIAHAHIEKLESVNTVPSEPSLQNALEVAKNALRIVPSYGSREILVVYGSLTTADPGDIFSTVSALKTEGVRCSFIGIGAEMQLLHRISQITGGTYHVVTEKRQLARMLTNFTVPSPTAMSAREKFCSMIPLGFPEHRTGMVSLCACHKKPNARAYHCPRCQARHCDLPTTCRICQLPLVASPHLARSYHHLFPIENFKLVQADQEQTSVQCQACQNHVSRAHQCPVCFMKYCEDCDRYIHEVLHNCIGCQEKLLVAC